MADPTYDYLDYDGLALYDENIKQYVESQGGGVAYTAQAVSIPVSAWSGTTATVSASAVTAGSDVIVAPAPASISAWAAAGVYCSAQGAGTLTFTCSTTPTAALTANVMAFEGGGSND